MLLAALIAARFSRVPTSLRFPVIALAVVSVFASASYGYNAIHQSGIQVPETIAVDDAPMLMVRHDRHAPVILRYAFLLDQGLGGQPEDLVLNDRTLQALAAIWVVLFALGVYG